jgi:hypothetical protein
MTAVTSDGARIGVEHSDRSRCSFPFFLVTATPNRCLAELPVSDTPLRCLEAADARPVTTVTASTTRAPAE